jgi:hypothetical protein
MKVLHQTLSMSKKTKSPPKIQLINLDQTKDRSTNKELGLK